MTYESRLSRLSKPKSLCFKELDLGTKIYATAKECWTYEYFEAGMTKHPSLCHECCLKRWWETVVPGLLQESNWSKSLWTVAELEVEESHWHSGHHLPRSGAMLSPPS